MPGNDGKAGPKVPPESFYCVFEFMSCRDGLALKGVELSAYALVYSYSQGKGGCYYGSNAMTAHRCGCSERHAIDVVHALEGRGLIVYVGEHRWRGRVTNMYAAAPGPVAEAIARCGGGPPPELPSPAPAAAELSSPPPPNPLQGTPEAGSPNSTGLETPTKGGDGEAGPGIEEAFQEILRSYPYTRDRDVARSLYTPLFEKGVRARHISWALGEWEKLHPAKEGRSPFYPELERFIDPNSPDGYCALARKAGAAAERRRAKRARELTLGCYVDEMYERYTLDGCDARASGLYRAHLETGPLRGEEWDRWYAYMSRNRDTEAREHWVEVRGLGRG